MNTNVKTTSILQNGVHSADANWTHNNLNRINMTLFTHNKPSAQPCLPRTTHIAQASTGNAWRTFNFIIEI